MMTDPDLCPIRRHPLPRRATAGSGIVSPAPRGEAARQAREPSPPRSPRKALATDTRNTVLFAGYQAAGTRGAAMLGGAPAVKIHGSYVPIHAEVAMLENLSAHADADEILTWLRGFRRVPRTTWVTHGEPVAADALRHRIEEGLGWNVRVPDYRETVILADSSGNSRLDEQTAHPPPLPPIA